MRRFQCLDVRVVVKQLAEVGLSIVSQGFAYYLVCGALLTALSVGPTCQQYLHLEIMSP